MLRTFDELTALQRLALHAFVVAFGNPTSIDSLEEMVRMYGGPAFTQGRTSWSLWNEDRPVATLGAVTECRDAKGEVYLTQIYADPAHFHLLDHLLQTATKVLTPWFPCWLKLGANAFVPGLPQWAESKDFHLDYRLVEMVMHEEFPEPEPRLSWSIVTAENAEDYRKVCNAAFLPSPNGRVMDEVAMQDTLVDYAPHPELLQLGSVNGIPAVSLSLEMHSGQDGIIDGLGVHPEFQGQGLGREGLHRGIRVLKEHHAERILLTVIDSNTQAVTLYRSGGFQITRTLSSIFSRYMKDGLPKDQ